MKIRNINCTLSPAEQAIAGAEYAAAARHYQATAEIDGPRARVMLRGERETLRRMLDRLIARESRCCSFVRFDRTESAEGAEVLISVQEDVRAEIELDRLERFVRGVFPGVTTAGD